ncbi:MAG: hypothetical protein IPP33_02515 [Flavobacteriales bacterium]|nr:hypothetical protein [Flavobacteriales bacterium]
MAKVNIQVPANNRHTPALNIINSAFYEQPNPNLYFPPDPAGGYLITGFQAVGYNPTNPKSGYALKLSNALTFQWMAKLDSPIPLGSPDWDMCSHGTYMWAGPKSHFVAPGTSPTGEQAAMATGDQHERRADVDQDLPRYQHAGRNLRSGSRCVRRSALSHGTLPHHQPQQRTGRRIHHLRTRDR